MWTTKKLADKAGVTDSHIRHLLLDGEIQGEKFGRDWAITDEEAQRWLEERCVESESQQIEEIA